jgi:hypothetical protein
VRRRKQLMGLFTSVSSWSYSAQAQTTDGFVHKKTRICFRLISDP